MALQVDQHSELLSTDIASIWLIIFVIRQNMALQIDGLNEASIANITLKRFLTSVCTNMNFQRRVHVTILSTVRANVGSYLL